MIFVALQLLLRRTLLAIPMLLCVSAVVFLILRLLPADPVAMSLPPGASAADYEKLREAFGFDRPLVVHTGSGSASSCRAISAARSSSVARFRNWCPSRSRRR